MTETITITTQEAVAPNGPIAGAKNQAAFYGTPATTVTVASSVIVNPQGFVNATINVPLGN